MEYLGQDMTARVNIDASTAKSIIEREGLANIRQIDVNVLWIHEQVVRRHLCLCKNPWHPQPADLMAKSLAGQDIVKNPTKLRVDHKDGRAELAPELPAFNIAPDLCLATVSEKNNAKKNDQYEGSGK